MKETRKVTWRWLEIPKEGKYHFRDIDIWGRIILKQIVGIWTGFIWLRAGTSDGLLWTQYCIYGFHKWRGISWITEGLYSSQEDSAPCGLVWINGFKQWIRINLWGGFRVGLRCSVIVISRERAEPQTNFKYPHCARDFCRNFSSMKCVCGRR